ncbi:diaminopimelate decarboxylase [Streptomyces sp. NBC_00264]|uniref:diaminopimelate decarboxylase n=1 Tax=unclassified Streptomyces TaxID=2593676 RepID=UPI00224FA06D|nr:MULTISPECIES: diaminopimelate decarboxylase [unclassified Streptomyces]MCX5165316.1 diaminopimelate decarboxylase [Streptomyces sp. NBC_00305]MCX5223840.1 diaminopimelate decarboxylase [Streptomyces sp. NBC_00264]
MTSAIETGLLPGTSEIRPEGLAVGGVLLTELGRRFGTPLFVYDEEHLRRRCREAVAAFGRDNVAYASKAFLCTAMARLAHEEGLLLDVASGGELSVALHAGVPAGRIVLHGNNKDEVELRTAMSAQVRHVVVDSFDEMDRIERLHSEERLPPARVQLRVAPGVAAGAHAAIRTGGNDSKFGFGLAGGTAAAAVRRAAGSPAMILEGVHAHVGSQVLDTAQLAAGAAAVARFAADTRMHRLTVGGGLGVAYEAGQSAPSFAEWAARVRTAVRDAGWASSVTVEPGRSIAASAGLTLYRVGTIKRIEGVRTYIGVDGGMSDNLRPALYGSRYEVFLPRSPRAPRPLRARLVGKHCESGDVIVDEAALPADVAVDDLLATPVTGAYGYAMASNYNKLPRPAVIFVRDGRARTVVRRETEEDLLRLDVDEPAGLPAGAAQAVRSGAGAAQCVGTA